MEVRGTRYAAFAGMQALAAPRPRIETCSSDTPSPGLRGSAQSLHRRHRWCSRWARPAAFPFPRALGDLAEAGR